MSSDRIHLDFESRSTVPFGRSKGAVTAYQYARSPDTAVWCMSYAIADQPVALWDPWAGQDFPDDVLHALRQKLTFVAHNAGFEWCLWNFLLRPRLGLPPLPFSQMDCTAARASVMALPRSLSGACKALGLAVQKDEEGARLMVRMAKPRKARKGEEPGLYWWDDAERRARLGAYCVQDTEAERALDRVLRPLSPSEREVWLMDHRTNMRGVQIDVEFAQKAQRVMAVVQQRYCEDLARATGGVVKSPTAVAQLKEWLAGQGVETDSLDKAAVIRLLADVEVPKQAKAVLQLRQEAGKSSVAKLSRFVELTSSDQRMRENFLFHGANTGRVAGKGAQLHNLPSRGGLKWYEANQVMQIVQETEDPEWAVARIELLHGSVPTAISSCLRGCIQAPAGKSLYVADFSNIEGRVAAWLGGEAWKIQAFRDYDTVLSVDAQGNEQRKGPDLYKVTAGQIIGKTPQQVDGTERNVMGKVPELALGFGGGVGAFVSMADIYNVNMADYWPIIQKALDGSYIEGAWVNWERFGKASGSEQDTWLASESVKLAWRARHPGIVACWYAAEDCAKKALRQPGTWFPFAGGKCAFGAQRIGSKMFLVSRLPSGRRIYRCEARLASVQKFGRAAEQVVFMGVDGITRQWVRMSTYGGDLFQSFVQAIARDLMMAGWRNVEDAGFGVVLSVHDEIGAEGDAGRELDEFVTPMELMPDWADGCPVAAAGYIAQRYRKD